ncbi:MAG: ABC transporter permease [Acidobacteriaceae bacterium]|nr:ABC transporter permease [Acidobacteriaceae bacterium]
MRVLQSLWTAPRFFAAAVLTLGLGIGANVACFSIIHAVLLKPLEYRDPDRLVIISGGATPTHFAEIKWGAHNFSSVGTYAMEEDLALSGRGAPELLKTVRVSGNFLEILGISPLLGRGFAESDNTALISSNLWARRFSSDLHLVGQTIDLAGRAYTVSGVLPPDFGFPLAGLDVWLTRPEDSPQFSPQSRALSPFLTVFGRLRPSVTLEQATAEIKVLQAAYAKDHAAMLDAKPKTPPTAVPVQETVVESVRLELWLLFGAVWLVLLIACANLASLSLARAAGRSAEFAIRSALGASRMRVVRHLLAESLLLSILGGLAGALLAYLSLSAIRQFAGVNLPRASEIQFDGAVLTFAVGLCLVTAILFGLAPSFSASRVDLMTVLRMSQGSARPVRLRSALVIGQIAISIVLLIGTSLLIESILHLRSQDLGFESHGLLTARIALSPNANARAFFEGLLSKLSSSPGVQHASVSLTLPMTSYPGTPVQDASQPRLLLNQRPLCAIFMVSPDYFQTLRIPLRRGRAFTEHDREDTPRVAIIDEGLARHFWPDYPAGRNPIGQRLLIGGVNKEPAEVVGIVADVHQSLDNLGWNRSVYLPFAQTAPPSAMVALRVENYPMNFAADIRRAVQSLNPAQPVSDIRPMQELVDAQVGPRRILMQVLAFFAFVALALAVIGIYGLISYSTAQRIREFGIRRALGAPQTSIWHLVLSQTFRLALCGVAIGVAIAIMLTRFVSSYLFQVSPTDPPTFVAVCLLFLGIAIGAGLGPAISAANVDPAKMLRYE